MKYVFYSMALLTFIGSCQKKQSIPPDAKPSSLALVIGDPVNFGEKDLLVFPIGANYNPEIKEGNEFRPDNKSQYDGDAAAESSDRNKGNFFVNQGSMKLYDTRANVEYINPYEEDFDMRNILFYNKSNGSSFLLSSDTLHFLSFAVHREFSRPLILFRVVKQDINGDGIYNSEDAVMLYVSDVNGKNLTRITPENERFFDYFYYPETQSILVKTALDIDKDKSFTALDETVFREMRIENPAFGREIFPDSIKQVLKKQISVLK